MSILKNIIHLIALIAARLITSPKGEDDEERDIAKGQNIE
jgi:hypothetical protein